MTIEITLHSVPRSDNMTSLAEAELDAAIAAKFPPPRYPHTQPLQTLQHCMGPCDQGRRLCVMPEACSAPQPDTTCCTDAGMEEKPRRVPANSAERRHRILVGGIVGLTALAAAAVLIVLAANR